MKCSPSGKNKAYPFGYPIARYASHRALTREKFYLLKGDREHMLSYFYGWYLKCQSASQTLAVIPAVHQTGKKRTCSIQIITDSTVRTVTFPSDAFRQRGRTILIGESLFCEKGIRLAIRTPELSAAGKLTFGPLSPLKYDIMGPFTLVPFMECRHSVQSMRHSVRGTLHIDGQSYSFENGLGYWEGDRGRSFPKNYAWTQCCFSKGALMLAVADIPIAGIHFTGIIGCVLWQRQEYRIATYLGARAVQIQHRTLRILQGDMDLAASLLDEPGHPLQAPAKGAMVRTIHENASCRAFYQFRKKGRTLFSFQTEHASFEYEYPQS